MFQQHGAEPYTSQAILDAEARLVETAGLQTSVGVDGHTADLVLANHACGITPAGKSTGIHQLRHHVASLLLAHGMSIAEVAEVLGDTVQEVSETYAHAMPDFSKRLRPINTAREVRIATAREESGTDQ